MDRFDDIWKNRFNEEELPVGDWNAPDDEVWKSISVEVFPEKDKRRLLWFWLGLGGVLLLLSVAIFWANGIDKFSENYIPGKSNSHLTSNNLQKDNSLATAKADDVTPINGEESKRKFKSESISVNVSPSNNQNQLSIPNTNNADINTITKNRKPNTLNNNSKKNKFFHSPIINNPVNEKQEILSNIKSLNSATTLDGMKTRSNEMNYLPKLKSTLFEPLQVHPILILDLINYELTKPNLKDIDLPSKFKISLSANGGVVFWKHRISDQYTSDLSPFDFNYENGNGWQTNLNLNISLGKKWDAFVGVQYEQVKTTSGHNSDIVYSVDNEINANPLNGYALSLATPYGLSGATFNFIRNDNIGNEDVDLLVDFHSDHLIKNISVPLGTAFYPLGKQRKFVPYFSAGIGVNYLSNINNSIQGIETNHDAIQYDDSGTSTFVNADVTQWHFDYRIGAGVTYELSRNFQLQFKYDYSRGINPIFELDQYNTRIDRQHISLGLTMKLD